MLDDRLAHSLDKDLFLCLSFIIKDPSLHFGKITITTKNTYHRLQTCSELSSHMSSWEKSKILQAILCQIGLANDF